MIINPDQTPSSHISSGKYAFNSKGAKNFPVKGINDKRQITAKFAVSAVGDFLPMKLIYGWNTKRCLPNFDFPRDFNEAFTKSNWPNMEKAAESFEKVTFHSFRKSKTNIATPKNKYLQLSWTLLKVKIKRYWKNCVQKMFVWLWLFRTT